MNIYYCAHNNNFKKLTINSAVVIKQLWQTSAVGFMVIMHLQLSRQGHARTAIPQVLIKGNISAAVRLAVMPV